MTVDRQNKHFLYYLKELIEVRGQGVANWSGNLIQAEEEVTSIPAVFLKRSHCWCYVTDDSVAGMWQFYSPYWRAIVFAFKTRLKNIRVNTNIVDCLALTDREDSVAFSKMQIKDESRLLFYKNKKRTSNNNSKHLYLPAIHEYASGSD